MCSDVKYQVIRFLSRGEELRHINGAGGSGSSILCSILGGKGGEENYSWRRVWQKQGGVLGLGGSVGVFVATLTITCCSVTRLEPEGVRDWSEMQD